LSKNIKKITFLCSQHVYSIFKYEFSGERGEQAERMAGGLTDASYV